MPLNDGTEGVVVYHLNLQNEWYEKTISAYLKNETISKWYMSSRTSKILENSMNLPYSQPTNVSNFLINYNETDINQTSDETKYLRNQLNELLPPIANITKITQV